MDYRGHDWWHVVIDIIVINGSLDGVFITRLEESLIVIIIDSSSSTVNAALRQLILRVDIRWRGLVMPLLILVKQMVRARLLTLWWTMRLHLLFGGVESG